ncbi:MAG: hypothetical protein LBS92_03090 [Candidatus Methanoplasma sp.]|jgi:hypothetical protein|nr:hypothetical protein [Candidatus Methanoplasma sp.]
MTNRGKTDCWTNLIRRQICSTLNAVEHRNKRKIWKIRNGTHVPKDVVAGIEAAGWRLPKAEARALKAVQNMARRSQLVS